MAISRTLKFLPDIFQTDANKKFVNATIDQLVSEPNFKKINGYIGRKLAPTYKSNDSYILEPTATRQNYQLEPAAIVRDQNGKITTIDTYADLLQQINYYGGLTNNHDRLFANEFYTFDPLIDLDKFVNFSQYYWLPNGPEVVPVFSGAVNKEAEYDVIKDDTLNCYKFSGFGESPNPIITLARGGTYKFKPNQDTKFWIQTEPGLSGFKKVENNISTRNILGVVNNGAENGEIIFNVPQLTAQDNFITMPLVAAVNYAAISNTYSSLHNQLLSQWVAAGNNLDGVNSNLDGKTLIFLNNDSSDEAWTGKGNYSLAPYDEEDYDEGTLVPQNLRYGIWKIFLQDTGTGDYVIKLYWIQDVPVDQKVYITAGNTQSGKEFYKKTAGFFEEIPPITANLNVLYYQDGTNGSQVGVIKIVETFGDKIDIENEILGQKNYRSPNGVEFTNGLKVQFDSSALQEEYIGNNYYVEGVGRAIRLVAERDLATPELIFPETSIPYDIYSYDIDKYDEDLSGPVTPDYFTINRSSIDLNPWTRSNRWFHLDVIEKTAKYNNSFVSISQEQRAVRPIIEFEPDLKLFNNGDIGRRPVDILDFDVTRPFNNIEFVLPEETLVSIGSTTMTTTQYETVEQTVSIVVPPLTGNIDLDTMTVSIPGQNIIVDGRVTTIAPRPDLPVTVYTLTLPAGTSSINTATNTFTILPYTETFIINGTNVTVVVPGRDITVTGSLTTIPKQEFTVSYDGDDYVVILPASTASISGLTATWNDISVNIAYETIVPSQSVKTEAIQGSTNFFQFGLTLQVGMTLIFANCYDPLVRNKIYEVKKITVTGEDELYLVQIENPDILPGDTVVTLTGVNNQGISYWYDGNVWIKAQQKTAVNQAPLFDLYDLEGDSFSNVKYPNSSFVGSKIFSYKEGTGRVDPYLGISLSYRNLNTVADITFNNNIFSDVFTYLDGISIIEQSTKNGKVRKIIGRNEYKSKNLWIKNKEASKQYQIFSLVFTGRTNHVEIDVLPDDEIEIPNIFVYINSKKLDRDQFSIVPVGVRQTVLVGLDLLKVGDVIDVLVYNRKQSTKLGYYEIPKNLNSNPLNEDFGELTLGQMRNHFVTIANNSIALQGQVPGFSNYRDLYLNNFPGSILQQSSPSIYAHLFLTDKQLNFIDSIEYAQKEYSRFKYKFLDLLTNLSNIPTNNPASAVEQLLETINVVKNKDFPWYYSDMIPYGGNKTVTTYVVLDIDIRQYELQQLFIDTELSNRAVLVYLNGVQLIKDYDYFIYHDRPAIYIKETVKLNYDDVIELVEYSDTDANFIPETPTKLGLYPKFKPEIKLDDTYQTPITVIQGHDGSLTPTFGDFRDDIILELEKRIYNNIKIDPKKHKADKIWDFIPGIFRDTDYTRQEFNRVLGKNFLRWVGNNRIDYTSNDAYSSSNKWTWNYSRFLDSITKSENLPGFWRGIYKYFFDTDRPHTHAWEMFGFSEKPDWWDARYGPAPYTGANIILWDDVEQGYIAQGPRAGVDPRFARPGVKQHIPVDQYGQLLPPTQFAVAAFNSNKTDAPFAVGDQGPVETAWMRSSEYPYAVLAAIALTKPGYFFGTLADITNYYYHSDLEQFTINQLNERIKPGAISLNGYRETPTSPVQRTAGYLNWISDYLISLGISGPQRIKDTLNRLSVQLTYKVAGYTDKKYIKIFAEQSSPSSVNDSIVLPEENYDIVLHKSTPINRAVYSAVIVQKTQAGYSVQGYNLNDPYFTIIPSLASSNYYVIEANGVRGVIYQDYERVKVTIPYGYQFTELQQVVDFLISYQRFLLTKGFVFDGFSGEFGQIEDWTLSAKEFLHWSQQGWSPGNLIVLSPVFNSVKHAAPQGTADEITGNARGSKILDTNFMVIPKNGMQFVRDNGIFKATTSQGQTIALADINIVEYEHALVFDNETIFKDIIYNPKLGERQFRLKIVGNKVARWTGQLDPAGFIYNENNFEEWRPGKDYKKGDIVVHKTLYYTAVRNLPASDLFEFANWALIDKNSIKTGLLPNFSNNAKKSEDYYDVDAQSQDPNFDKFAYGLIGFRTRPYLTDLGLDTTSQVKFYQGFIREKGTSNAVTALTSAKFNNVEGDIKYYEEWAFRVGEYGAIYNNQFFEVVLPEQNFLSNPSILQLLDNGAKADTEKVVGYRKQDLYVNPETYRHNFLLPRDENTIIERDIETAGFVHLNDIDATLFTAGDYTSLNEKLADIGPGYKIWLAKGYSDEWDVFRVTRKDTNVKELRFFDSRRMEVIFNRPHGLQSGEIFLIKNFYELFDGFYQITDVVDNKKVFVYGYQNLDVLEDLEEDQHFTGTGPGLVFNLVSVKFQYPTQINESIPVTGWRDGDKFWVKADEQGKWAVYEKYSSWRSLGELPVTASEFTSDSGYGYAVALSSDAQSVFASEIYKELDINKKESGSPVIVYGQVKYFIRSGNELVQHRSIIPTVANTANFGYSIAVNKDIVVIGAPGSNNNAGRVFVFKQIGNTEFANIQILEPRWINDNIPANAARFGHAITISDDQNWMYISAPGWDAVYPYQLRVIDEQTERIFGDNIQTVFTLPFAPYRQEMVSVYSNEEYLIQGVDFTIAGSSITFTSPLPAQQYTVRYTTGYINNKTIEIFDNDTTVFDTTLATPCTFSNVTVIRPERQNIKFGNSLATSTDGRQLIVGAPADGISESGKVYIYDRHVQSFNLKPGITLYDAENSMNPWETKVFLNSTLLEYGVDYDVIDNDRIELLAPFGPNDVLTIETNYFSLQSIIEPKTPSIKGGFGTSVDICPNNCSIYVGEPNKAKNRIIGGAVHRYVNQGRVYGTILGNVVDPLVNIGDSIYINNILVEFTGTTLNDAINDINNADILGISARNNDNRLEINSDIVLAFNKINITKGKGTALIDLGLEVYPLVQTIEQPPRGTVANFGIKVKVNDSADQLLISSAGETTYKYTTFDNNTTLFDQNAIGFAEPVISSGATFIYEYLVDQDYSVNKPGQFVFGQQLYNDDVDTNDKFGYSIDFVQNYALVSSFRDSYVIENNPFITEDNIENLSTGNVYLFTNDGTKIISKIRQQEEKVDIESLTRLFVYDRRSKIISTNLDFIDPAKGKILGQAEQYLDYKSSKDPAVYNSGGVVGLNYDDDFHWGRTQVGKTWWDLSTVRYIEYEQDTLEYRTANWGRMFPGSVVTVYEWIESNFPPSQYQGEGVPKFANNEAFVTTSFVDVVTGIVTNKYYFWVSGKESADPTKVRNISIVDLERLISNPTVQGIPYAAPIRRDTLALFNINDYLKDVNTILHVDYEFVKDNNLIHSEYELVQENNELSKIPDKIFSKLVDSLVGADIKTNLVPDARLQPSERYGLGVRPLQTILINRTEGVKNFVGFVNNILSQNIIFGQFDTTRFFLKATVPPIDQYDEKVANIEELTYRLLDPIALGTRILVESDEEYNNRWTLREVNAVTPAATTRVVSMQSYDTSNYWEYATWYDPTYDPTTRPTYTVESFTDVAKLTLKIGDVVKVKNNGSGNFEILEFDGAKLVLLGLENGNLQLSSKLYTLEGAGFDTGIYDGDDFDSVPFVEFRNIIEGIIEDVFVNNLKPQLSTMFFTMMNYILSEQISLDWAFKTSFVSIVHKLRKLDQFPSFVRDNQDYYLDYINEVKPYRTKIREYLLDYEGFDQYDTDTTDFDLPAYYDSKSKTYRSPDGTKAVDLELWQTWPNIHWYNNHTLSLERLDIINAGTGFANPPSISIVGDGTGAAAVAYIDLYFGNITRVEITNPGTGYTSIPRVVVNGDGTGAVLYPVMRGSRARQIETTLTFDRTTYLTAWQPYKPYHAGALVFYEGSVYKAKGVQLLETDYDEETREILPSGIAKLDDYKNSLTVFTEDNFELVDYYVMQDLLENTATGKFLMWNWRKSATDPSKLDPIGANQIIEKLFAGVRFPGVNVDGDVFPENGEWPYGLNYDPNVDSIITRQFTDPVIYESGNDIVIDGGNLSGASNVVFDGGDLDTVPTSIIDQGLITTVEDELPGDIIIDGNKFVSRYHSHAPEELVPGQTFDNLVITVFTLNQNDVTRCIGYRIEHNIKGEKTYRRIAESASTRLIRPLYITDTEIIVQDITKMPDPAPELGIPGTVYINGEKIYYWGKDLASSALVRIRRGVDGTGVPIEHPVDSRVDDAGRYQLIPAIDENAETDTSLANPSQGQHWYNVGVSTATDGQGLWFSNTIQAQFLRNDLSYLPPEKSPLADLLLLTEDIYGYDSLPYDAKLF